MKITHIKKHDRADSIYDYAVHEHAVEYAAHYVATKTCPHRTFVDPVPCAACLRDVESDLHSYVKHRLITQKEKGKPHASRKKKPVQSPRKRGQ